MEKIKLTDGTMLEYKTISENVIDNTLSVSFTGKTYEEVKPIFVDKTLLKQIEVLSEAEEVMALKTDYDNLTAINVDVESGTVTVVLKQTTLEKKVAELEAKVSAFESNVIS